jgi:hypothetical protein
MPPLPVVPQVCKLIVSGTYHDSKWINLYYVHYSGGAPSSGDLSAYLTHVDGAISGAYEQEMSVDNEITGYEITDLTSDTGNTYSTTASHFGTRSGDFVPSNVAMVCSFEINRRYRGGHPRKYLPWGTAGTYATGSTNQWDSGFVADCQTYMEGMVAGLVGVTEGSTTFDQLVNVSYRTAHAVRADAVVDPVVAVVIRSRICTQRRRLGKIGA